MNDPKTSEWAIEIEGITKSFGNRYALKGIDLKVKRGDSLTLFGPNGAGKTTLIRILSTMGKPSKGTARLEGADIRKDPLQIRQKLGIVSHAAILALVTSEMRSSDSSLS